MKWEYAKTADNITAEDCGWVDHIKIGRFPGGYLDTGGNTLASLTIPAVNMYWPRTVMARVDFDNLTGIIGGSGNWATSGYRTLFATSGSGGNRFITINNGVLGLSISGTFRSSGYSVSGLTGWNHIAAVGYSVGSTGYTVFYVNGVRVGSVVAYQLTSTGLDTIGNSNYSTRLECIGRVDDAAVFNRALSQKR